MLFNSIEFLYFLPIVFAVYWILFNKLEYQNIWIVASSFLFYGWWDWRFLLLMIGTATIDFIVAIYMEKVPHFAKKLLLISIVANLGILGFFKYCNFFIDSFSRAFTFFGENISARKLEIVLPVGISFYTFQAMSYTIDVYRKQLKATHNIVNYFAFISFFPQLVAGPIERATNLLPQFLQNRTFDLNKSIDGMRQILWGFFKKIVIADNISKFVYMVYGDVPNQAGSALWLATILFGFQIYCDFSGYSDIAIGTARLFGFQIMRNFNYPYLSRDIAEFWRRWHISLSTWFRDYVYFPLGGSRGTLQKTIFNTFVIFLISGFWHGANFTFIAWGFVHALFFLPLLLFNKNRSHIEIVAHDKLFPNIKEVVQITLTMAQVFFAWIFFVSKGTGDALMAVKKICSSSSFNFNPNLPFYLLIVVALLMVIEFTQRKQQHVLYWLKNVKAPVRWGVYIGLFFAILIFGSFDKSKFIYFDF